MENNTKYKKEVARIVDDHAIVIDAKLMLALESLNRVEIQVLLALGFAADYEGKLWLNDITRNTLIKLLKLSPTKLKNALYRLREQELLIKVSPDVYTYRLTMLIRKKLSYRKARELDKNFKPEDFKNYEDGSKED